MAEHRRRKHGLTVKLNDSERALIDNIAQIEDRTLTSVIVRGLNIYAELNNYCLNPLDCGSVGPTALCRTCAEAFDKDMTEYKAAQKHPFCSVCRGRHPSDARHPTE